MHTHGALTARSLLVEAQSVLQDGAYRLSTDLPLASSLGDLCFIGEDQFGVVLVVAYETWSSLSDGWREAQAILVKLLTDKLNRGNPKAWEGYLVLLTPSPSGAERAEDEIRYDTSRVRKIVGTGESIRFIDDLLDVLMPLLPLNTTEVEVLEGSGSVLDRLPEMLAARGIARSVADTVVNAFRADAPLLESIQDSLTK
jgi:hypothetical protein